MKFIVRATFPHEKFNEAVKNGTAGNTLEKILKQTKPEAVYFHEYNGKRCATMIINMDNPSELPSMAEPWFLSFDADFTATPVMTPEDLKKANLNEIGKKWS